MTYLRSDIATEVKNGKDVREVLKQYEGANPPAITRNAMRQLKKQAKKSRSEAPQLRL